MAVNIDIDAVVEVCPEYIEVVASRDVFMDIGILGL